MTGESLFTPDFKALPYWWDGTPRPDFGQPSLPARADVVVVGSGYTGLSAALQTVRGGRSTVVLDADAAGWGCSTRNGGQVSSSVKPSFSELASTHGEERARQILLEGHRSLAWLGEFVAEEKVDCDYRVSGRFHAAHSARQYDALVQFVSNPPSGIDLGARLVPRSEQRTELGTDAYHGGMVHLRHAAVDAARLHRGLLERAVEAGAIIVPHCTVTAIEQQGNGFRVITSRGEITARNVVVGTNAYSGRVTPWLRRRIVPIGSYIIATEPIPRETMDRLFPTDRMVTDTRKVIYYYRASPDRTRILFGGRVSWNETDPTKSAPLLHAEMVRVFPEIAAVRVSHSWMGFVGFTFDRLMHTGVHDGIHYAAGYCGSGIGMATYLGMKLGLKILGKPEGESAFDNLPFPTRPYYTGYPWFLGAAISYYRWRDRWS
jgi:glycine/D-amino acid oxidase-like deaminating enzyme